MEKKITQKEIEAREAKLLAFYETAIPNLEVEHKYHKLEAEIEHYKLSGLTTRRKQLEIQLEIQEMHSKIKDDEGTSDKK